MGFRSIGRYLGVSHASVQNWIKRFGPELENLKSENEITVVELDEMHTYIENKKNIAGSGMLLIELGKDSSAALLVAEELKQDRMFIHDQKEKPMQWKDTTVYSDTFWQIEKKNKVLFHES